MDSQEKKPNNFQVWLSNFLKKYFGTMLFVLILLFFTASYYLLLLPRFQDAVVVARQNSSEQERKYIEIIQKLTDLKSLARAYQKIDPKIVKKVEEFLPTEYVQEQLFLELEQVIIKNGYTVNSISVQKELGTSGGTLDPSVGRVKVSISVSSVDYNDFKKLLSIIEANIRLMDVIKLSFNPGDQSASFEFYTYFFKTK